MNQSLCAGEPLFKLRFPWKQKPGIQVRVVYLCYRAVPLFESRAKHHAELRNSASVRGKGADKCNFHLVCEVIVYGLRGLKRRIISPSNPMDINWKPASIRKTPMRRRGLLPMASPPSHSTDR